MKTFGYKVRGLDKVLREAEKQAGRQFFDKVDNELDTAAVNVAAEARANAKGNVAAGIYANNSKRFRKSVGSNNPVAAYVEFGTGPQVFQGGYSFTADEKQFAKQFYVSGKGKTKSHAYLFPAFHREIPKLMQRLRQLFTR